MNWSTFEASLLSLVIWREARGEGYAGMLAVGCSIRNRVNRPSWWGKSYAECIGKKWQYSAMTAPGDPQLIRFPKNATDENFHLAMQAAGDVIAGQGSPVPGADSYYDISIPPPKWATTETYVGAVGKLRFHNLDHDAEVAGGWASA